ncbi:WXG100 family type VII secretion target [Streptomyces platensis]|uniref:WXG100 family type VII secretion target n=1 Tax=Streptomyces platensis TaxID=58346 RepID=UPI002E0FC472|nr:WXG100 family type VII secretion target [Streptomyces platensis]WTI53930.1 WXG100 family type VII secretion target [Streptomyces platensis]WUB80472.1 WXG100 family type VII secretion target [Streptomyces platensis]
MSGNESVAEEIVELGIEIVHPGGRPDELKEAAQQWRHLKTEVDRIFGALDKQVNAAVGHTWRGPAAEAFHKHWNECKKAADHVTEHFDEAAAGLDKAAKAIEEVNNEIEDIYIEIGISVGVSIGMSFVTFGVSAAVGTARIAMLAKKALDAAGMLGRMLRAVANAYKAFKGINKYTEAAAKLLSSFALNSTTGTAGGVATSLISGKGPEWGTNLMGGLAGATIGTGAGAAATRMGAGEVVSGAAAGAAGGVGGDALDSWRKGEDLDMRQTAITAVAGGAAGGAGATMRSIDKGLRDIANDLRGTHTPESHDIARDTAWGTTVPIAGGVAANDGKDGWGDVDDHNKDVQSGAKQGTKGRDASATDEVRNVFG